MKRERQEIRRRFPEFQNLPDFKEDANRVFFFFSKASVFEWKRKYPRNEWKKLSYETLIFFPDDQEPAAEDKPQPAKSKLHGAQALFPSTLCTAFVEVIALLGDQAVSLDGTSVYDVAYEIVWSCLVEDSNLFFKYFMEKLTRDVPESTFQILRALIR